MNANDKLIAVFPCTIRNVLNLKEENILSIDNSIRTGIVIVTMLVDSSEIGDLPFEYSGNSLTEMNLRMDGMRVFRVDKGNRLLMRRNPKVDDWLKRLRIEE